MTTMTSGSGPADLDPELAEFFTASTAAYQERLLTLLRSGRLDAGALPAPEEFVEHGIHARQPTSPLPDLVGPVYTSGGVQSVLGISRQQLADRRQRGTIVAARTGDGRWVYPVYQFRDGELRADVREVLDTLRATGAPDPWTLAVWFPTDKVELGGVSPLKLLDTGQLDSVLTHAASTASRWAA
jgi:hypothetical protein